MKTLLASTLAALVLLAGCTSIRTPTASQIDTQYEYGSFAGLPQRPSPDSD
jgi:hypothetical protein